MKKIVAGIILSLVSVLFIFSVSTPVVKSAVTNSTDELSVSVQIEEKTIVDVSPASLEWTTPLEPGSVGERKDIQIENLGSVNLTHIWFNNSQPTQRPFGTARAELYDSGNWMTISRDSDGQTFYFPSRMDFNESQRIIYLTGTDDRYGRFRNSSYEYFWNLDCDANGASNCTGGDIYIADSPHTESQTGDSDLGDNAAETLTSIGNWGWASVTFNGLDYCVAVNPYGNVTQWYKWNMDAPGAESCGNAEYFVDAESTNPVVPGESAYARVRAYVPYGVYYNGTSYSGSLTVLANTI
ncbi:MAG: hypothetical protein ABEK17_00080 [Candidatus Aenigmatarchaeota archaeon]